MRRALAWLPGKPRLVGPNSGFSHRQVFTRLLTIFLIVATFSVLSSHTSSASASGASQFSGVVVDANGVAQAGVTISLTDAASDVFTTTTASDGSFSLTVDSAPYQLSVSDEAGPGAQSYDLDATVDLSSASLTDQTLTLPFVPLTVVVSDSSGNPISGASVQANLNCDSVGSLQLSPAVTLSSGSTSGQVTALTDNSGSTTFSALPCAADPQGYSFDASASGFNSRQVAQSGPVTSATTFPITLFQPGETETFAGVIQDQNGDPVAGVQVSLSECFPSSCPGGGSAVTASDGSFSLTASPYAYYTLSLVGSSPDGTSSFSLEASISLLTNTTGQVITLPFEPFSVQVNDSSGSPVAGATLSTPLIQGDYPACYSTSFSIMPGVTASTNGSAPYGFTATTNAAGTATVSFLPCQNLHSMVILVQPPANSGLAEQDVTGPTSISAPTTVSVTLASLSGTLVDSSGQPLDAQVVSIENISGTQIAQTSTGASGTFALTVPPGTYEVETSGTLGDPTTYSVTVPGVNLTSGQQGTFELPTEEVTISVTGPGGAAVDGATVRLNCVATAFPLLGGTASGSECATEVTGALGESQLEILPAGEAELTVTPPPNSGLSTTTTTFDPSNGLTVNVELEQTTIPQITSSSSVPGTVGKSVSFTVTTTGTPTATLTETGALPKGLHFSANTNGTATISGIPTIVGSSSITITAKNSVGSVTQTLTFSVNQSPTITSSPGASATVGKFFTFSVTTTGTPTATLTETGALPNGVLFNANAKGAATVSGAPAAGTAGSYPITLTATNAAGSINQSFVLVVTQ